jgi:hypothetical protein
MTPDPVTGDCVTADTLAALAALPRLAAQAAPRHTGRGGDSAGVRTAPGSKPPPGVDLDAIDVSNGRQHPALLERLAQCVRVVWEEHPSRHLLPPVAVGDEVTWASESAWLLETADWWMTDAWCVEWIERELLQPVRPKGILVRLSAMIEAQADRFVCQVCGVRLEAHATDTLMVAMCPACERVAGMRPRLTERQRADAQAKAAGRMLRAILGTGERMEA